MKEPSASPLLTATQLRCERGGINLFSELDLVIYPGELVHVVGPNGSGKTTLLRILAGLNTSYEGTLSWLPVTSASDQDFKSRLLYLGHKPAIKLALTPLENLRWYFPSCTDADIIAALSIWKLKGYENLPCYQLSAGQQQRVALTRLLLTNASLWLLDEPFTAIDQTGFAQLEQLLLSKVESGVTVLLTSHHIFRQSDRLRFLSLQQVAC